MFDYNVGAIQVLGCSLSVIQHTAIVDVPSGNLVETQLVNFSSEWTPLVLANSTTDDFFDGVRALYPFEKILLTPISSVKWASIFYNSPVAGGFLYWAPSEDPTFSYTYIATIDRYVFFLLNAQLRSSLKSIFIA